METPFDITKWQPTDPASLQESETGNPKPLLSQSHLKFLAARLSRDTRTIQHSPYDPQTWLQRAQTLRHLRYPELVFADAWKAEFLAKALLEKLGDARWSAKWNLGARRGFWMRNEENSFECLDVGDDNGRDHVDLVPAAAADVGALMDRETQLKRVRTEMAAIREDAVAMRGCRPPRYLRRPYPWMSARNLRRSDELIKTINAQLRSNAANEKVGPPFCEVRRHAFGLSSRERQNTDGSGGAEVEEEEHIGQDTSDVLGVFACRDIPANRKVVIDKTRLWGCNGAGASGDHLNLNGGRGCTDLLHPNQPNDSVHHDLRWIRDRLCSDAADCILFCRLLLTIVQADDNNFDKKHGPGPAATQSTTPSSHPLDHSLVARLTPRYPKTSTTRVNEDSDIEIPLEALRRFGVDIFASHAWDSWVLFTIDARCANNCAASPVAASLGPLFSLFNHSCEPNCGWIVSGDHGVLTVETDREVKCGEQLFVEYDGYACKSSLEERRRALMPWLDGDCVCTRCLREEAEMEEEGLRERKKEEIWDVYQKLPLPEDAN